MNGEIIFRLKHTKEVEYKKECWALLGSHSLHTSHPRNGQRDRHSLGIEINERQSEKGPKREENREKNSQQVISSFSQLFLSSLSLCLRAPSAFLIRRTIHQSMKSKYKRRWLEPILYHQHKIYVRKMYYSQSKALQLLLKLRRRRDTDMSEKLSRVNSLDGA